MKIVLLQDNERPMVGLKQSVLITWKFKVLAHPTYRLDLSPCDYEVFRSLKKFLEGKHFCTVKEAKKVVKEWMLQIGAGFWRDVIYKFSKCRQKCIDRDGDYVEH